MRMKISGLAAAATFLSLLTGCAAPPRDELPGRYENTTDSGAVEVLVLEPGGTGQLENLAGNRQVIALKWTVGDNYGHYSCTWLDFYSIEPGVSEWHTCAEDTVWSIVIGHPGDDEMAMFRKVKW